MTGTESHGQSDEGSDGRADAAPGRFAPDADAPEDAVLTDDDALTPDSAPHSEDGRSGDLDEDGEHGRAASAPSPDPI